MRVLTVPQTRGERCAHEIERCAWQRGYPPRQGTPGQKRATVFLEDPVTLAVLVETRYLTMPTFGTPQWSTVRGDPALEKQLLEALRQAMGG